MRLGRLIRGDIHFQWKYGFYFIYFTETGRSFAAF